MSKDFESSFQLGHTVQGLLLYGSCFRMSPNVIMVMVKTIMYLLSD